MMKAVVYEKFGAPDVLRVAMVEKPEPREDELLIKVRAAEVTKADCEMRSLKFQVPWLRLPMRLVLGFTRPRRRVLGGYFAGEIEALGKNATGFGIGDAVFGAAGLRLGAHGEYLCLPAGGTIVPKPRNLSFAEAAAVPLGGLNAIHFLRHANLRKGESVLVNGAGGSIGIFGVQIAKAWGAEVTVVDGAPKAAMLRRLGADHFVDYATTDFAAGSRTWDVIFSMVANSSYSRCLRALAPGGRYLMANPKISDMLRAEWSSAATNKKAIFAFAGEKKEELLALKQMIEDGRIRPVIDGMYTFEQAAEAHQRVETEARLGAVVISASAPV